MSIYTSSIDEISFEKADITGKPSLCTFKCKFGAIVAIHLPPFALIKYSVKPPARYGDTPLR